MLSRTAVVEFEIKECKINNFILRNKESLTIRIQLPYIDNVQGNDYLATEL